MVAGETKGARHVLRADCFNRNLLDPGRAGQGTARMHGLFCGMGDPGLTIDGRAVQPDDPLTLAGPGRAFIRAVLQTPYLSGDKRSVALAVPRGQAHPESQLSRRLEVSSASQCRRAYRTTGTYRRC